MKTVWHGESVHAFQFQVPFTFNGLRYGRGSWIVIGNGWRDAYLPDQFVTMFGHLRGPA